MMDEGIRWELTAQQGWECTDTSLGGTDCKRVQHRWQEQPSEQDSLSESKISTKRTSSDIPSRGIGVEREARSVRKDSIVDVGVLHDRSGVVPFAVEDESDAQQSRRSEGRFKRGDGGGHGIALADTYRDCFAVMAVFKLRVASGATYN